MNTYLIYRIVWTALVAFVGIGLVVVLLVHPPSEAAGPRVVDAVELSGQIRLLVDECTEGCLAAMKLNEVSPQTEYDRSRAWLTALDQAAERLSSKAGEADRTWVPVDEAAALLEQARKLVQLTRSRLPLGPVSIATSSAADPLESDPDKVGITTETAALVRDQVQGLKERSTRLRGIVERAVLMTSLARESLAGFELKWVLLLLLIVAGMAGAAALRRAEQLLQVPPMKALETQLRVASRIDPRQAIETCHKHSRRLLQVADEIVTVMRLSGAGMKVPEAVSK